MPRGGRSALVAAALALGLSGCGGEGSPEEEVTKSVRTWTAGLSGGDGRLACDHMTTAARRELAAFTQTTYRVTPSSDCATNVKRFAERMNPAVQRQTRDADVAAISIRDTIATVRLADGGPAEIRMVRQDGRWRVDRAFAGGWRLIGAPRFGLPSG